MTIEDETGLAEAQTHLQKRIGLLPKGIIFRKQQIIQRTGKKLSAFNEGFLGGLFNDFWLET